MQLSKQTEKEVLKVYDTWLHSYLHGDVAIYDSSFDDDCHFIGSTDINKLADEYLRLAYHSLRARDKSFNALMETDFDPAMGKILVAPQDIGNFTES